MHRGVDYGILLPVLPYVARRGKERGGSGGRGSCVRRASLSPACCSAPPRPGRRFPAAPTVPHFAICFPPAVALCLGAHGALLSLTVIVRSSLIPFGCTTHNGVATLNAEPSIQCSSADGTYRLMRSVGAMCLVVYGAGLPTTFAFFLHKHARRITADQRMRAVGEGETMLTNPNIRVRRRFRKLYEDYKPEYAGWKLVLILRKLVLAVTGITLAGNPSLQVSTRGATPHLGVFHTVCVGARVRSQRRVAIAEKPHFLLSLCLHVCVCTRVRVRVRVHGCACVYAWAQASLAVSVMILSYVAHQRCQPFLRVATLRAPPPQPLASLPPDLDDAAKANGDAGAVQPVLVASSRQARVQSAAARGATVPVAPAASPSPSLLPADQGPRMGRWGLRSVSLAFVSVDYNLFESAFLVTSVSCSAVLCLVCVWLWCDALVVAAVWSITCAGGDRLSSSRMRPLPGCLGLLACVVTTLGTSRCSSSCRAWCSSAGASGRAAAATTCLPWGCPLW